MSRPHDRALAWLARHPTVIVAAVALSAAVVVAAVGDMIVLDGATPSVDMEFDTTGIGSQTDGPNTVGDGGGS